MNDIADLKQSALHVPRSTPNFLVRFRMWFRLPKLPSLPKLPQWFHSESTYQRPPRNTTELLQSPEVQRQLEACRRILQDYK